MSQLQLLRNATGRLTDQLDGPYDGVADKAIAGKALSSAPITELERGLGSLHHLRDETLSRLCGIGHLGGIDHVFAEEVAEAGRRMQVHVASEELAELVLQIDELEEADPGIGGELDEHVDVALGAEVLTQNGAEEGEPKDAGTPAEGSQALSVDIDLQTHAAPPSRSWKL